MKDNPIVELYKEDFIKSIKSVSDNYIQTNDQKKAFDLSNLIEEALKNYGSEIRAKGLFDIYQKIMVNLKFIALPLLEDKEVINLARDYFTWQYAIPEYNFFEKLKVKLIYNGVPAEKDKLKDDIKKTLLSNNQVITSNGELKTVGEWLRDYNFKIGTSLADNLKRTEFMVGLKSRKGLNAEDIEKLKSLFDLYERLKFSSSTPSGFEEEPAMVVNNNLYIFRQGKMELVMKDINKKEMNSLKTPNDELTNLRNLAAQFKEGSLERKAVEEELRKMNQES